MEVQQAVINMWIIVAVIAVLLLLINHRLKKFDPLSKPTGIVLLCMMGVNAVDSMVKQKTNDKIAQKLTPYMCSVVVYIFLSNIAGLFSLESPTSNYSVTVALAAITCVLIEYYSIKYNGIKEYIHSLCSPIAPFAVINILSKFSTLLSLSLRLFGNIIAGSILMSVIYQLLGAISSAIPLPFFDNFNVVAIAVAPVLHFYFDLFSGAMQSFIFITLSISFIGKELPRK